MRRAAIAIVLVAIACASCSSDHRTTLKFWALGFEGDMVSRLIPAFEAEHPDIRVEIQQVPFTVAHEKLLTAYVGDATPDVAQLGNTWIPELASLTALAPLDAQVAGSPVVRPPDYFAGIWETNEVDGALYGVPWYVDTRLLFYRRDLFAQAGYAVPPKTWEAWLDAMRKIKRNVGRERFGVLLPLEEFDQLVSLALQEPEPMLRDHGRYGNFRSTSFRAALTLYLQMFVEELAPITTQIQVPNPWDELARGYFSCFLHGPWSIGEFKRRLPPAQQGIWATTELPSPTGVGGGLAGGSSLVIFRRSQHPREAWQLIEWLSRPEIQQRFYDVTGNLPPRRSSWQDARFANEYVQPFRAQLEHVKRTPPVPEWERIVTEMRYVTERAARKVSPRTTPAELAAIVDTAVRELDGRADEMLDKRRWLLERAEARR